MTLERLESRYGVEGCISSKCDSLKINYFSHAHKSNVIDDLMVIKAIACGLICYWDWYKYATKLNLSSNFTTIQYGHQMQPQTFCKPKVKQKISHNRVGISSFSFHCYVLKYGVTWWIVMVIWGSRYWTRDLDFSFNFLSYLDIYALDIWCYILYPRWFARCWPYDLLP